MSWRNRGFGLRETMTFTSVREGLSLASRVSIAKTPPFGEGICCLSGFLGETGDSGPNPGLDGRAESREIIAGSRTNYRRNLSHVSESRSGLKMGDFLVTGVRRSRVLAAGGRFSMLRIVSSERVPRSLFAAPGWSGHLCGRSPP